MADDANRNGGLVPWDQVSFSDISLETRCDRYAGFDPPIWEPMEITFEMPALTAEQIDALFPLDQLGDDPRWVDAIRRMKDANRRKRENGGDEDAGRAAGDR